MNLRIVRFPLKTGTYETIATSLDKNEFPIEEIKSLYHLRWGIETSFRSLKYAIGLTNFHARKEESILQEIFARLLIYNFCSKIANSIVIEKNDENTYSYKINFTQAIHLCFSFLKHQIETDVRELIRKYIEPVRPGREDKRNIKPKTVINFTYRVA